MRSRCSSAAHARLQSFEDSIRKAPFVNTGMRASAEPLAGCIDTVYTGAMQAVRAKLFQNGGSQAVRLPRDCRFPEGQREVRVHREGARVILEPVDDWPDDFRACLGGWSEPVARPRQVGLAKLKDPFE